MSNNLVTVLSVAAFDQRRTPMTYPALDTTAARLPRVGVMAIVTLIALLLSPMAMAEPPEQRRRGEGQMGEKLHERMKELRGRILKKRVGLDAERIDEVEAILQKGDQERKGLHRAMRESHEKLRHLIKADAEDGASYEAAVGTLLKSRQRLHELQHGELERLRELLSPKEMGKLVMALHRLKKRMKRMHERAGGDEMDRGRRGEGRRGEGRRGRRGRRGGGGGW